METLEQKLKQFKHTVAVGEGYPRGYKANINALMKGFNSGRFNAYLDADFVKTRQKANELLETYNYHIKNNWQEARKLAVGNIMSWKQELETQRLLYGNVEDVKVLEAKIRVAEFVCYSLPLLKRGE